MSAHKGNQYWKQRSKHGRSKLFSSSQKMWEAAVEYFEWCEDNPIVENGWGKSKREIQRPFTMTGLCVFLDCNTRYFDQFKKALPKDEQDFSSLITRIEEIIYTQKFEGAAAGIFNHNIIARDLGLKDNQDFTTKGKEFNPQPILFLSADRLTDKQIEDYLNKDAGNNNESI
jgi:hypothetical protein